MTSPRLGSRAKDFSSTTAISAADALTFANGWNNVLAHGFMHTIRFSCAFTYRYWYYTVAAPANGMRD